MKRDRTLWTQSLDLIAAIVFSVPLTLAPCVAQSTPPTDQKSQGDRGLGIRSDSTNAANDRTRRESSRPELVLQTGYTNGVAAITFSPDGRLLATKTYEASTIKIWEIASGRELRTLNYSSGASSSAAVTAISSRAFCFSPDSRILAGASDDNTIKLWDVVTGREIKILTSQKSSPSTSPSSPLEPMVSSQSSSLGALALVFSPNGGLLASIHLDAIRIWDLATGHELRTFQLSQQQLGIASSVSFTPDGNQLAMLGTGEENAVRLWDVNTGRDNGTLRLASDSAQGDGGSFLSQLAFRADGHLIASANSDKAIKIWDVTAKNRPLSLSGNSRQLTSIVLSSDGQLLASASGDTAKVYDSTSGQELRSLSVPTSSMFPTNLILCIAFGPEGRVLATGGVDSQIRLWDPATGRELQTLAGHSNDARAVRFSVDGKQLFSGSKTIWDIATGRGVRALPKPNGQLGTLSSDGKFLASWSFQDKAINLNDVTKGREIYSLSPAEDGAVKTAVFSPDGHILASTYMLTQKQLEAGANAPAIDQDQLMRTAKQAQKSARRNPSGIMIANPADLMKVYQQAISGSRPSSISGQVILWDVSTGRQLQRLSLPSRNSSTGVSSFAFNPDGKSIAAVGDDGVTRVLSVADGHEVQALSAPSGGSGLFGIPAAAPSFNHESASAFSPDGRIFAKSDLDSKSSFDPAAMMSAAMSGRQSPKQMQKTVDDMVKNMSFKKTPIIRLYDLTNGSELRTLSGPAVDSLINTPSFTSIAFSADGRLLASSGSDKTIRIWNVSSGNELKTFAGTAAQINSLALSPDSRLLVSASDDGATRILDLQTGETLCSLISLYDGSDWLVVTPDGLFDGSPAAWNQILWRFSENTFDVSPAEAFFNEFYSPGLLQEIMKGKRPKASKDISQRDRRQPKLKLSLADGQNSANGTVATRDVRVKIELTEAPAGARDVRLFRNGSLVKFWRGDVPGGPSAAQLEATIPIIAGENRLQAYAFNHDSVKSPDVTLTINGADSLARAARAHIVAVGVNQYANPQYNLRYAVADAQSFGEEVKSEQLKVGRYESVEVISLLDQEATRANILTALKILAGGENVNLPADTPERLRKIKPAEPEDTVIIFYAGHGTAQNQRFYLIPHDLGYTGERTSLTAAGLQTILSHSISDLELEDAFEGLDASKLLFVIDACNSGQALEAEEKRRGPMNSKGLAQLAYEKGMYILAAAQSFQAAQEAARLGHGYLTYALVEEGLKKFAADDEPKDGQVFAREWLDYATERVPQMQEETMIEALRSRGVNIAFADGDEQIKEPEKRSVQRPRVFYRRELENDQLLVAKLSPN